MIIYINVHTMLRCDLVVDTRSGDEGFPGSSPGYGGSTLTGESLGKVLYMHFLTLLVC